MKLVFSCNMQDDSLIEWTVDNAIAVPRVGDYVWLTDEEGEIEGVVTKVGHFFNEDRDGDSHGINIDIHVQHSVLKAEAQTSCQRVIQ